MLKNLCAIVFLVLAMSPFTAPFQTCDDAKATVVAPLTNEDDPGSLVAPPVTKAGRLTVAPTAGPAISPFVSVTFLTPFISPTSHTHRDSIRPTVLRV